MSKRCIFCGEVLEDDDVFCNECGKRQDQTASEAEVISGIQPNAIVEYHDSTMVHAAAKAKKGGNKKALILAMAAVLVLVVAFAAFLGGASRSSEDAEADTTMTPLKENNELTDQAISQASMNVLIGYIDQSEEALSKVYDKMEALQDEEYYEGKFGEYADLWEQLCSDLSALQDQANAVNIPDITLKNAKDEYFSMVSESQKSFFEIWTFMADYFELGDRALFFRPQREDYTSMAEYRNALNAWYQECKEGYTAITSCPPCLESQWKRYGETLDLNDSICKKLNYSEQYNDPLRLQSALNMSARFDMVDEIQYGEFLDALEGEMEHSVYQRDIATALAKEIHAYGDLEETERSEYEFEYIRTGRILLNYDAIDTIYPSLYNSYDAFLVVKTGCVSGTRTILVEAEIPGFTQNYKETFTLDSAYKAIYIKPPALTGDLNLSTAKDAQIKVTISDKDGSLIEAKTFPVTIKSKYDFEWYSDEYGLATKDNILCFLTPEASAISNLKRQAIDEITSMTNGEMESFVGYQHTAWNNHFVGTYLQAAGIMRALYESGVRYNMDPFSISGSNQHILFPEDVLKQKSGLCIETSLVVASALQSAGMHVFLVFPPGHAQVAVEVWNGRGNDKSGTGQYFLIETTGLSADWNNPSVFVDNANALLDNKALNTSSITYYNSKGWQNYLTEDTYIIDCDDLGVLGMTPFAN